MEKEIKNKILTDEDCMELAIEERRECGPFFLPAVEIPAFDMCFLIA